MGGHGSGGGRRKAWKLGASSLGHRERPRRGPRVLGCHLLLRNSGGRQPGRWAVGSSCGAKEVGLGAIGGWRGRLTEGKGGGGRKGGEASSRVAPRRMGPAPTTRTDSHAPPLGHVCFHLFLLGRVYPGYKAASVLSSGGSQGIGRMSGGVRACPTSRTPFHSLFSLQLGWAVKEGEWWDGGVMSPGRVLGMLSHGRRRGIGWGRRGYKGRSATPRILP